PGILMQTIARSMADTGPMGGRRSEERRVGKERYRKRPHSRLRNHQLRTVHDLIGSPRAALVSALSGIGIFEPPITRCSSDLSLFTLAIAAFHNRTLVPCAARVKKGGGATACSCVQKPPRNRLMQVR